MTFLKDYEPVEDRLRAFWEQYPQGRVTTELLHHADGAYIVIARVYRGDELRDNPPAATGLARDAVDELAPNLKHSALEICETSAIGRALANLGYAAKGKRPSREEMSKASAELEPAAMTTPTSTGPEPITGADRMGEADGSEGGSVGEAPNPSGPPSEAHAKSDLSFHPNRPHRMKDADDFPGYRLCTIKPCPYWEYVGKEKA